MFNCISIGFYSYWDSAGQDTSSSHIAGNAEKDAGFNNTLAPHNPVTGVLWHMKHIFGTRLMISEGFVFA